MRTYRMTEEQAEGWDSQNASTRERAWIEVRREALAVALEHDEMTAVETPDGEEVDVVYPSSINP